MQKSFLLIVAVLSIALAVPAAAQDAPAATQTSANPDIDPVKIDRVVRYAKELNAEELNAAMVEIGKLQPKLDLPSRRAQMERWNGMTPDQRLEWRRMMAATWDKQTRVEKDYMRDQTIERLAAMPSAEREAVLKALETSVNEGNVAP